MVGLGILDFPKFVVPERSPHFTIWRYKGRNCSIWREKSTQRLLGQSVWL
ncbi:hypothetical protein Gohar_012727 [Gossypium harknessii]|uniref:Uncharacterized protein n=2 Tax=Gossypium TaxID=3633 RepID=A0A7J8NJK5_9ROSI|nr:hypothetical protein [Gossypium lobatum]MBA0802438.1 hypothetical protein [Gossypium harknessii]